MKITGLRKALLAAALGLILAAQLEAPLAEGSDVRGLLTPATPVGRRPGTTKWEAPAFARFAGCELLLRARLSADENTIRGLQRCSNNLRNYYGRNYHEARRKIGRLPSALRDFIALTRTAAGEVHPRMPQAEHLAVMKTLTNRAAICQASVSNCDTWDVATEARQFSMYNDSIHRKNPVLFQSAGNPHQRAAIVAYIAFQGAHFAPAWEAVTHYHLASTAPAWAEHFRRSPASALQIDGVAVKSTGNHHVFYNGNYRPRISESKTAGVFTDSLTSMFVSLRD